MSYSEENSNQNNSEELESAQKNQRKVGSAESDPSTTGPAENYERKPPKIQVKTIHKNQRKRF